MVEKSQENQMVMQIPAKEYVSQKEIAAEYAEANQLLSQESNERVRDIVDSYLRNPAQEEAIQKAAKVEAQRIVDQRTIAQVARILKQADEAKAKQTKEMDVLAPYVSLKSEKTRAVNVISKLAEAEDESIDIEDVISESKVAPVSKAAPVVKPTGVTVGSAINWINRTVSSVKRDAVNLPGRIGVSFALHPKFALVAVILVFAGTGAATKLFH